MKKATVEELKKLERGHPLIINLYDDIMDVALFLQVTDNNNVLVIDSVLKDSKNNSYYNIAEYKDVFIIDDPIMLATQVLNNKSLKIEN